MGAVTQIVNTRTALTVSSLATLANNTYCVSNTYTANTNKPMDVVVEAEVATTGGTPTGNKQIVVFVKESLDGTNFRSGPETGTSTTDEPNLRFLGTVPMNSQTTTQRGTFSIAQCLGYVPHSFKLVFKNECGFTLTTGAAYTSEISGNVA